MTTILADVSGRLEADPANRLWLKPAWDKFVFDGWLHLSMLVFRALVIIIWMAYQNPKQSLVLATPFVSL